MSDPMPTTRFEVTEWAGDNALTQDFTNETQARTAFDEVKKAGIAQGVFVELVRIETLETAEGPAR